MADLHFSCTACGRCCHDLRLTLSAAEALAWAGNGDAVQVLVEALPGDAEPAAGEGSERAFDRARGFAGASGDVPFRIVATLVAHHAGPCPHLRPDMLCGNYEARPRICRIYPLHRRPGVALDPSERLCPPEAWDPGQPLLVRDGEAAEAGDAAIIAAHRAEAVADAPVLRAACAALGITTAAFAGEGLAVHRPAAVDLVAALQAAARADGAGGAASDWTLLTNRRATRDMLAGAGCSTRLVAQGEAYLGSFSDEP